MSDKTPEKKLIIRNSTAEFLIFTQQAGESGIEVRYENSSIWLTQKLIAELFEVSIPTVNEHLKNIYATSVDYNKNAPTTRDFFAKVQNKLHYAIHGHTASELVLERADSSKPNMGLQIGKVARMEKFLKPM
jgi:hypothetical protein